MTMTTDEFFAEAKHLGCRMHLGPEDQRAAFDLKDAEIERLRAALGVAREPGVGSVRTRIPKDAMEQKIQARVRRAVAAERKRCAAQCRDIYSWRGAYYVRRICSLTTEACAKAIEVAGLLRAVKAP